MNLTFSEYRPYRGPLHLKHGDAPCCSVCCEGFLREMPQEFFDAGHVSEAHLIDGKGWESRWRHFDPHKECWYRHPWFWRHVWPPVGRLKRWIWTRKLVQDLWWKHGHRAPIKKWWVRWLKVDTGYGSCYNCGLSFDWCNEPWFKFTEGGAHFNGEYTQHWFGGVQTCPRCLVTWEHEDSD